MRPYYDEDGITIYHADCREVLSGLTADVVLTDPPYGTGLYATDTEVLTGNLCAEWVERFRSVAVFGWPERLAGLCIAAEVVPDEWVTWNPTNGGCRGFNPHGLWRVSEHIAIFGPGKWSELRRPKQTQMAALYVGSNDRHAKRESDTVRESDVWTDAAPGLGFQSQHRQHPNEKPTSVMHRLIEALTEPSETVVDPFMGSGTTLRAAKDLGRKAIGIEIVEEYCQIAVDRLAQGVLEFA